MTDTISLHTLSVEILTVEAVRAIVREEMAAPERADQLLTAKQAASLLNVAVRTIWEWTRTGKIPYIKISSDCSGRKIYRFRRSEIMADTRKAQEKS